MLRSHLYIQITRAHTIRTRNCHFLRIIKEIQIMRVHSIRTTCRFSGRVTSTVDTVSKFWCQLTNIKGFRAANGRDDDAPRYFTDSNRGHEVKWERMEKYKKQRRAHEYSVFIVLKGSCGN